MFFDFKEVIVASLMSIVVVVAFEVIDIDHQQGQMVGISTCPPPFFVDLLVKAATIWDVGQAVDVCEFF